ncbi:MAG: type II secretion system F family protein [Planctomycetota bacterium]
MPDTRAMAYHNLYTMLDAGVPLLRSLNTIAPGLDPRMRKAFLALADGVSQGNPLAETMSRYRKVFRPVDIMLVEAAETSGNLADIMGLLAKWHEMSQRMLKRMLSGLLLPFMILLLAGFIAPVPAFVMGGWDVESYLLAALKINLIFWVPAIVIVLIIRMSPQTGFLRRILDHVALRIPVLGRAMYNLALSRYCWVFHMLCKAGAPVANSMDMAVAATGNAAIGDLFRPAAEAVRAGGPTFEGLSPKLPKELVEMWKVGEETGQLDDITQRLATNYGETAEFWFNEFARWFPRFVYAMICIMMIVQVFRNFSQITTMSWT